MRMKWFQYESFVKEKAGAVNPYPLSRSTREMLQQFFQVSIHCMMSLSLDLTPYVQPFNDELGRWLGLGGSPWPYLQQPSQDFLPQPM